MPNKKSATRLSANILNYFAAFTETRFNFRTLINYRWTNNEELVKSPKTVIPDLIRYPEVVEFTGFRLSPE